MKIKVINFGIKTNHMPSRAHYNDAGADVYMPYDYILAPGETIKIPLGFGLELPDGLAGFIFPRSNMATKSIVCELPPIDSGYRGEIHAIINNTGTSEIFLKENTRIGQLVIFPVILADFVLTLGSKRGAKAFGSTGE